MTNEEKYQEYMVLARTIEEGVANEIPNFEKLTSKQRIKKLSSYLTSYVESQRSANTYAAREKKNPKWKKDRELAEYLELLTSTRIRMGIHCLNDEELNMYVDNLVEKLADAIAEMDVNKKFKKHDIIIAGCQLCNVDNVDIMQRIASIKNKSMEMLRDIRSM